MPTRSTTGSPSKIPTPGRGPGALKSRCSGPTTGSSNMRVPRGITIPKISSASGERRNATPRRPRRRASDRRQPSERACSDQTFYPPLDHRRRFMRKVLVVLAASLGVWATTAASSEAHVVRFVVEQTRPIADGKSFGDVGPYERLDGTVYIEIDPRDPLNAGIVNLDKAAKTAKGMVGFSSPFFILKPVDMTRGNRKILYGVNNRGNKLEYAWRTILPSTGTNNNNPTTGDDFGDGLIMRLGYTYVDAGWQGNLGPGN